MGSVHATDFRLCVFSFARDFVMFRPILLACVLLSLLSMLVAESARAADPRATLDAFSRGLEGLSGQFHQRVFAPDGRLNEESRGTIALSIPRQFRWEYQTPFPQLIVADGDKVWIFDPDLEQVQVRPQGAEEQQSPLTALVDASELDRQFRVSDGGDADGLVWVKLEPKGKDAPFASARLGFSGVDLARMEMIDSLAQRTEVSFSGWQRNPVFAADAFRFVPPAGVDVIGEVDEAAQAFPLDE